jgi:hypothetical protein
MADSKKPYGDVEYADEGLQSDGVYRYPIDTEEHAKSAWSYINKDSNASKYSADDLAKVKAKIKAACKKFGVEISDGDSKAAPVVSLADVQQLIAQKGVELKSEFDAKAAQIQADADERIAAATAKAKEDSRLDETVQALALARKATTASGVTIGSQHARAEIGKGSSPDGPVMTKLKAIIKDHPESPVIGRPK